MFTTITISLMSMNVFIGIVGNLYREAKDNVRQIHCNFQAGYIINMLLYREFVSNIPCCKWLRRSKVQSATKQTCDGYFICYDPEAYVDMDRPGEKPDNILIK